LPSAFPFPQLGYRHELQDIHLTARELSLAEYDLVQGMDLDGSATAKIIAACIENPDGTPFVDEAGAAALPLRIVQALTAAILDVSGMGDDEGKSETTPPADSGSS
jgi:hypothetical protein